MHNKAVLVSSLALLGFGSATVAFAVSDHGGHHHLYEKPATSHEAHVHGEATMMLAMEGKHLEIALESPAANIIGFEHKATTDEEKRIEQQAAEMLKSADLFSFAGSQCELEQVILVLPSGDHHKGHDDHAEDHHDNHDKHDDHHDEHKDHDSHADHESETHSEVTAEYKFECNQTKELTGVTVGLFKPFPKLEKIDAMWVSETNQGSDELSATKNVVRFK